MNRGYAREPGGTWPSKLPSLRAPLLLIELVLELVGATFGGMMLACICGIYILCHMLVHYTTCTTPGRAVMSLTTSTISSITQHISGNSDKLYTSVTLYNLPRLARSFTFCLTILKSAIKQVNLFYLHLPIHLSSHAFGLMMLPPHSS
jgi:anaerobic C4-dicarboxylate transporter